MVSTIAGPFFGLHVMVDENAVEEVWVLRVELPRSKKKRIRKKCRRETWVAIQKPAAYQLGRTLLIHPQLYHELCANLKGGQQTNWKI